MLFLLFLKFLLFIIIYYYLLLLMQEMRAALQEVEILLPVPDDGRTTVSSTAPMEVDGEMEEISSNTSELEVSSISRYTGA